MENELRQKLQQYIVSNNPELLLKIQDGFSLQTYIQDKVKLVMPSVEEWITGKLPGSEIETLALHKMTADLRPSRFQYLKNVLQEEFPEAFELYTEKGKLTYELVNIMEKCNEVFHSFGFSESTMDNHQMRHAVIIAIHNYLP